MNRITLTQKTRLFNLKVFIALTLILFAFSTSFGQMVSITANPGTSGNVPFGVSNYHAGESIYLQSEINTAMTINRLNYSCGTLPINGTQTYGSVSIYMKLTTSSIFATGTYSLTGYTLVYSGPFVWVAPGLNGVNLTTPFVYPNNPGENLQILVIRTDAVAHSGAVFNCALGNAVAGAAALTSRRYNGTTFPTTASSLTASNFRPAIQLGVQAPFIDVAVGNIYTLGKLPIQYGAPTEIKANVVNPGSLPATNISVNLSITGANTFSNTVVVPTLAAGASTVVTFAPYSPTSLSTGDVVNITAIAAGDAVPANDGINFSQDVTQNVYTYKNPAQANAGGVGFNGGTGDFVAKFNSHVGTTSPYLNPPQINEIKVDVNSTGQQYQVGIWSANTTTGLPDVNLWTSPVLTSAAGAAFVPVPNISVNGDYFVGVRQTGVVNIGFGYQAENPIRSGTFYFTSPTGGTTWTNFAPNTGFRFSIEVTVRIPIAPNCAINFYPADGSAITCNNPVLTWQGGGGAPDSFDVYFSTNQTDVINSAPGALVSNNQTTLSYNPGVLANNTTYYWKIIPKNVDGSATGCGTQSFTTGTLPVCYCVPAYTGTPCTAAISQVTFNTLTNSAACTAPGHAVFNPTGALTTSVEQGSTYALGVTTTDSCIISVWIDYNQNGTFEASEWQQVALSSVANIASTASIVIPASATLGQTVMRVRSRLASNPNGALDACTGFGSGSSQDYVITIVPPVPCSGTPNPGNTIASTTSVCSGTTVNFSLQNTTNGTGVTYQWNNNSGPIAGATNAIYAQVITVSDDVYCDVTCGTNTGSSNIVTIGLNSFLDCYCASSAGFIDDEEIYNVTIAGVSTNPLYSLANACGTIAPGPGSVLNMYSNFKTLGNLTSVAQGDNVPFVIEVNECDGAPYWPFGAAIWIDFNHNGSFADAGEQVFVEATTLTGPRNVSGSFIVPTGALTGQTAMRITAAESVAGTALTSCLQYGYGETEDYLINITAATPCTGTPAPGNTIASANNFCGSGSAVLSLSGQASFTGLSGISYQWSNSGGPIVGATNAVYNTGTITSSDIYSCAVSCSFSSSTATSAPVTIVVNTPPTVSINASSTSLCAGAAGVTLNATGSATSYSWSPATGLSSTSAASVTATPSATTTYVVTGTDGNTCTSTSSVTITVNTPPTVSTSASSNSVCPGDSVQFTTMANAYTGASLLTTTIAGNGSSGNVFDVIATNTVTLTGFKMVVQAGTVAEVWYKAGSYGNASLTSSAGWTKLGATVGITSQGAGNLTDIPVTATLTIPAGQTYGIVVVVDGTNSYTNGTTVGNTFSSNADLAITEGHGGAGLGGGFNFTFSPRVFNGQVSYLKEVPVTSYAWTPAGNMNDATIANPKGASAATTTYSVTVADVNGCTAMDTEAITVISCGATTLTLNAFIEGYWDGSSAMVPTLANQGQGNPITDCDSILVELHSDIAPFGTLYATTAVLQTNGTAICTFSPAVASGNYYIAIKHRNALQTWSANPVAIGATGSYNFTTAQTQAYGTASQVEVATGVWALYSGDVVIDENMDLLDLGAVETDASGFLFGYYSTDLTGDGNVDLLDSPVVEINAGNFVFSQHP